MFCFQCEQTAGGQGCAYQAGVCGKSSGAALLQDMLTAELIVLATELAKQEHGQEDIPLIHRGLFATITNVSFDEAALRQDIAEVRAARERVAGVVAEPAQEAANPLGWLWQGEEDIRSLKSLLLFGLRGMAAYAHHAGVLGQSDATVDAFFLKGLRALQEEERPAKLLGLLMELGKVNLACMALLDSANTGAYGDPIPQQVSMKIAPGPFIVVTGHDLHDLHQLLEQSKDQGVNIYTHSEMLPAHGYPELHKFPHLKGHFGTAWHNQQKEFAELPAPILYTTNCLMPPRPSYADKVYTTSVVSFPGAHRVEATPQGGKDFSPLIAHALELGGYPEEVQLYGINGGSSVTTGYGRKTVLDNASTIIDAVKAGAIKHFFLVGGCDGAKSKRSYYTEFVQQTPADTVILTLACGKYRFNDLDLGQIGPFPRVLDMGQCNDAYGAIQVAVALAEAFDCGVNELPLTLVLSWYEQKAVVILLTLLALGIKNIYIGPSLPAFFSPNILATMVEEFALRPITTPEEDLAKILGK
ncbi:MAG: hydroxylamine reductase [Symbiobacteriaceae bacterium]|nr:hydroxylamine reductase [Symbiobacteriaceae bacterium]